MEFLVLSHSSPRLFFFFFFSNPFIFPYACTHAYLQSSCRSVQAAWEDSFHLTYVSGPWPRTAIYAALHGKVPERPTQPCGAHCHGETSGRLPHVWALLRLFRVPTHTDWPWAPVVILLPSCFPRLDFPPSRATGWPSSPPTVFRHAAGLTKALFIFL